MSLLTDLLIKETAASGSTGAGAIANARGSLFGGGAVDLEAENKRKTKMMRRIGYVPVSEVLAPKQSNTWKEVYEAQTEDSYDQQDVIAKLDDAEKKAKADKDTVCFGLEDEDGGIVKVYVRSDQADDFEAALATALSAEDEDENEENSNAEIAEVLFNLKDKFEIVDVEWGVIQGDEEEEQELEGGEEMPPEGEGEGEMDPEGGELEDDMGDEEMVDDESAATSALQDVIDVMKADAEARQAEANAKKAEADADTAKYAADASASKVQQEEEILDMEAHEKAKSDADKEAKTLAKLAKYKHETQAADTPDATVSKTELSVENEESNVDDDEISKEDLAALLLKHMAHN